MLVPSRRRTALIVLLLSLGLGGCTGFGSRQVPVDQFDYNNAIARSLQEQMLLNVVRLRYFEAPVFLAVSSVLTQYVWQGSIGVTGQQGLDVGGGLQSPTFVGGAASAQYAERPTVTFLPIEGDDFARRLMSPIPLDFVFAIGEAGYPVDLLFRAGIARMNEVENMGALGTAGDVDRVLQARLAAEGVARFQGLVDIMQRLYLHGAIEVQTRPGEHGPQRFLVIAPPRTPEVAALVQAFRTTLDLDPAYDAFRITDRRMGRDPDEITIKTRSLLQMMSFLAGGVEVPAAQLAQAGLAADSTLGLVSGGRVPFRARTSVTPPQGAFVATRYNGHWFAIDPTDVESKRAFNTLIYLFRLLAPERATQAPLLSLPTGP